MDPYGNHCDHTRPVIKISLKQLDYFVGGLCSDAQRNTHLTFLMSSTLGSTHLTVALIAMACNVSETYINEFAEQLYL